MKDQEQAAVPHIGCVFALVQGVVPSVRSIVPFSLSTTIRTLALSRGKSFPRITFRFIEKAWSSYPIGSLRRCDSDSYCSYVDSVLAISSTSSRSSRGRTSTAGCDSESIFCSNFSSWTCILSRGLDLSETTDIDRDSPVLVIMSPVACSIKSPVLETISPVGDMICSPVYAATSLIGFNSTPSTIAAEVDAFRAVSNHSFDRLSDSCVGDDCSGLS
mmetsp:Transcript_26182/g.46154  ORF Transcript_26182/g.46154 Transcript_26182/m.46154 type:complete len:217 (+) Transcript_26182:2360-3010(+)